MGKIRQAQTFSLGTETNAGSTPPTSIGLPNRVSKRLENKPCMLGCTFADEDLLYPRLAQVLGIDRRTLHRQLDRFTRPVLLEIHTRAMTTRSFMFLAR